MPKRCRMGARDLPDWSAWAAGTGGLAQLVGGEWELRERITACAGSSDTFCMATWSPEQVGLRMEPVKGSWGAGDRCHDHKGLPSCYGRSPAWPSSTRKSTVGTALAELHL